MSLIEEALRRVQEPTLQPTQQKTAPITPTHPSITAPPQAPKQSVEPKPSPAMDADRGIHSWPTALPATSPPTSATQPSTTMITAPLLAVALAVLALTAVLIIGGAFWMGRVLGGTAQAPAPRSTPPVTIGAGVGLPPTPQIQNVAPAAAARHSQHSELLVPRLVLNGIVEGSGAPYAVINGTIVGIGEQFQDLTLLEINHGVARLRRSDGNELLLRISR